ncbi:hypothetical protein [Acinetobacter phage HFM1]|nr:hypothetical protein [Acinetobacter phage HFM1]
MTNIATVAKGVIDLISVGREIYEAAANAMDSIEAKGGLDGASKKEWVLAYVKGIVFELGEHWDEWIGLVSEFIDKIKSAYNAVRELFA